MTKEQFYDKAYQLLDYLLRLLNVCDWHKGQHGQECRRYFNPCCEVGNVCHHLSSKGCKIKSLSCRLYLCSEAQSYLQRIIIDTTDPRRPLALQFLTLRIKILDCCYKYHVPLKPRATKEETFAVNEIPELSKDWDWFNQEFPLTEDIDLSTYEINAYCK